MLMQQQEQLRKRRRLKRQLKPKRIRRQVLLKQWLHKGQRLRPRQELPLQLRQLKQQPNCKPHLMLQQPRLSRMQQLRPPEKLLLL